MIKEKAVAFLKVRPEEVHMVTLVAALFFCIQAGQGMGENAAFALFLARLDVDLLPYMYMGLGGVVFMASLAFAASLGRFRNASVVTYLLVGAALVFMTQWVAIVLLDFALYPVLWLTTFGMGVIFSILLWTVAGEVCDARQAKRLFPLFTSMAILGSVVGNLLTGVLAHRAGTESLIILYAALLGAGFFLTRRIASAHFRPRTSTTAAHNLIRDVRAGYEFVRTSPLFQLMAISSIVYSVLFFTLDFSFSDIVSGQFTGDEAALAAFKGLFTSITTAVTFAVALFLANRLLPRLGIVNSVLAYSLACLTGIILFFIRFDLWGAAGARFTQIVVLSGFASTAWNALYNVVPSEKRGQVLAFINGVPTQAGVVLSGLLIILSNSLITETRLILLIGAVAALVTASMTLKMKPAYGEALLSALRAGRVEVFSDEEEAFSGYQHDPDALQAVLKALHDPKAGTRRLAAEMLARMNAVLAIPDLLERLSDEDAAVRAAAIQALADLDAQPILERILFCLDDPDDLVRDRALVALLRLGVPSSPGLVRTLEGFLQDANTAIRARAAVLLIALGEGRQAKLLLAELLKDTSAGKRELTVEALGQLVANIGSGRAPFDIGLVLKALKDSSPLVRQEAVRAVSLMKQASIQETIADCLSDDDATVRRMASELLRQAWPESREFVVRMLEKNDERTLDAALDALPPGDREIRQTLREYMQRELSNLRYLRGLRDSLPQAGRATLLLRETLKERESGSEERLIKAIGLLGDSHALDLIRKSLNTGDSIKRAAALEALETLGDRQLVQEVLPILDRGDLLKSRTDMTTNTTGAVEALLSDEDYWLRALAARSVSELKLSEFLPALRKLLSDPIPFVKQAAYDALASMDGDAKMKTLKTLSTLERVLLLREVPMFSRLKPEDLEQIAEIAQEQLYSHQAVICRQGEPGNTLFIIVNGKIEVLRGSGQIESLIAVRGVGEFVGEMAILESAPRFATLRAQGDVRVLVIDGEAFKAILMTRPEVAISVLQHMSTRVRQLNEGAGRPAAIG
ncbi:MAG TPA: HEAT repeat domain-containing protein [Anaerolineales bacterium]|nr:HEAT repeat domain-containing protein [Anaerolineales bacterium]